jgi:hypothetical protein
VQEHFRITFAVHFDDEEKKQEYKSLAHICVAAVENGTLAAIVVM